MSSLHPQDHLQPPSPHSPPLEPPDIDMLASPPSPNAAPTVPNALEPPPETRSPTKKDISLQQFLNKMDDYAPIIPDAVTLHHLALAGLPPPPQTPLPLARLLALATQKFIADIAADAYQYSRMRSSATTSNTVNPLSVGVGGALGAAGAAGVDGTDGAAGGGKKKDAEKGKGVGGHVLGVQRAGYGGGGAGGGQGRAVLTMEDLGCAVGEYGVSVKRGEFYR